MTTRHTTLTHKIAMKRVNADKLGIPYLLTREDVEKLLFEAMIEPSDWSRYGYHLARYNDTGRMK